VEDDKILADTLKRVLQGRGSGFLFAASLAEASDILESSTVHLVILDRVLPDGDGVELLKKMKAAPALNKVPVLILSGKTDVPDQVAGLDLGADDYMSKPFSVHELQARVDVLLRRAKKFVSG